MPSRSASSVTLMPPSGTPEITRKWDWRSPFQSSAANVSLTSRKSSPISNGTCHSSWGTPLTVLIKPLYLLAYS